MLFSLALLACGTTARFSSHVLQPADPALAGLQRFTVQPTTGEPDATLAQLLSQALERRGYRDSPSPQFVLLYALDTDTGARQWSVNAPAPMPLGPSQAVHRLPEQQTRLSVRLTDLKQRILWEASGEGVLAPANTAADADTLEQAVETLLQTLPRQTDAP
ncbi:MAG: DUF4136 domain-containing protein [Pseudomonas sp.]|uniref:DUF4136 domain-containing protein n=1 Tax=Pseudomonas sp. TaxID=306 RepID=UPI00339737CD